MTQETYERACTIEKQIDHINSILSFLEEGRYECEPPIRDSGVHLSKHFGKGSVYLNEGEIVCIQEALKSQKAILEHEFGKL